ncbi:MAG: PBP1A family penicillin-binding protein [Pseudomonadota bacterium]
MKKKSKKPKKKSLAIIFKKKLFTYSCAALLLTIMATAAYCLYLAIKIDKRFSGRRWDVASRVFSDVTLLHPGQGINLASFKEKLYQLGYREVSRKPKYKGEFKASADTIDIFLHDLAIPGQERNGLPVRITLAAQHIESINRVDTNKPLSVIELEPEEIMLLYGPEHERRHLIAIKEVPRHFIRAVLAAEDKHFFEHYGLDPIRIMGAFFANLLHGAIVQGGSTITQQLAKNYFLTSEKTIIRKINEVLMSVIIEAKYDKDQILEMYFNEIYLGQKGSASIHGIGEASWFYFGKHAGELSLSDSAALAGLIKAPGLYSPFSDKDRCIERRNFILQAMHENKWISDQELQSARNAPLQTARYTPARNKAPYFIDYLSEQLKAMYSPEILSSLGLSIYTTLDTQVQKAAERALEKGLAHLEKTNPRLFRQEADKKLQGAVLVMQPGTGAILAMVGGRDYSITQFNRITQAKRQPGSAFKPFVYLPGLDTLTPASKLSNEPRSYTVNGKLWEPQNYEHIPDRQLTMRDALARSVNLAAIDLSMRVGPERIISTARAFCISTPLKPSASLPLGVFEVLPLELGRAYCAFASGGVLPNPLSLQKVVDEQGEILSRKHMSVKRIISPEKTFIMNSLLRSVVTHGTARSLNTLGIAFPSAGKTGTTNDCRDAWFIGYTPDILALVWVGFDDGDSMYATGASAALPIWAELMKNIPQHISKNWFPMPEGVVQKTICTESGKLAVSDSCPGPREEYFLAGTAPDSSCPIHQKTGAINSIIRGINRIFKGF